MWAHDLWAQKFDWYCVDRYVKVGDNNTEKIPVRRGISSPLLFNLYSKNIFQEILSERVEGAKIFINKVVDDSAILAESIENVQLLVIRVHRLVVDGT